MGISARTTPLAIMSRITTPQVTATTLLTILIQDLFIAVTTAHVGSRDATNPGGTLTDATTTDATGDNSKRGFLLQGRNPRVALSTAIPFPKKPAFPATLLRAPSFENE